MRGIDDRLIEWQLLQESRNSSLIRPCMLVATGVGELRGEIIVGLNLMSALAVTRPTSIAGPSDP